MFDYDDVTGWFCTATTLPAPDCFRGCCGGNDGPHHVGPARHDGLTGEFAHTQDCPRFPGRACIPCFSPTTERLAAVEPRCFACDRPCASHAAVTSDGQTVLVGSECIRKIRRAGAVGYQPPLGGPVLFLADFGKGGV